MDHLEAIEMKAAERYVLGDLPGGLREEYEEHFFGCVECAEELKLAAAFVENTRAAMETEALATPERVPVAAAQRPASSGWFAAFLRPSLALPVFAALMLVVAYQSFLVIPRLKDTTTQSLATAAPQTLASFSLLTANSRGAEPATITVAAGHPFSLYFDIPPDEHFSSYVCEFQNASGTPEYSLNISAEQAQNAVQLLIPSASLGTGKHVLVISGLGKQENAASRGTEVARYPFTLVVSK
jgi:hypothetical protein